MVSLGLEATPVHSRAIGQSGTTLSYEWYVLMFTSAADNRPTHYMDGGILYLLTPNMQVDLRAGFGLSDRPDDLFTGAGYSVRF